MHAPSDERLQRAAELRRLLQDRRARGETLIGLLKRAGVSDEAAMEVVRAATASAPPPSCERRGRGT